VVEKANRGIAHRPKHGEPVIHLSQFGQKLGKVNARDLGGDGFENAFDIGGDIIFGIPKVQVTGAPLEVNQNNALSLPKTGSAIIAFGDGVRLKAQQVGQAKAKHRGPTNAKEFAAGNAITIVTARLSGDYKH